MIFPAPEWTPDQTNDGSGVADEDIIQNVIPDIDSYRPWQSQTLITGPTALRVQGAIGVISNAKLSFDYAGDANNLYRLVSLTWLKATNATLSATFSYSTSVDQWWEFETWGDAVLATNGFDPVQEISLGAANFTDLAGVPPKAYHIGVVRDFVWLGNILNNPQRVQWSAINNSHSWTVDATTQADFQDLLGDGGQVQRIIGGNTATVFQERSIWKAQYVGSPAIFDFGNGPVSKNIGLLSPQSAVRFGESIFFLSEGGFYRMDQSQISPIGHGKIDRTLLADLDSKYVYRVQGIVHPIEKLYIVAYPGSGNSGGNPNKLLIYNFYADRWSTVVDDVEMLFRYISTGYTLEGLDPFGTIDTLPATLDSFLWAGGQISLAAFNTSHKTTVFNGTAKDAIVTTREFAPFPGRSAKITRTKPLVDSNAASVTPITRNRLADARVIKTASTQNSNGDCPLRANAQYFSFRIGTTGNFTRIRGVEVLEFSDSGTR